jgi:hypothetical protein
MGQLVLRLGFHLVWFGSRQDTPVFTHFRFEDYGNTMIPVSLISTCLTLLYTRAYQT